MICDITLYTDFDQHHLAFNLYRIATTFNQICSSNFNTIHATTANPICSTTF